MHIILPAPDFCRNGLPEKRSGKKATPCEAVYPLKQQTIETGVGRGRLLCLTEK